MKHDRVRIVWASALILDFHLHKTTQLEILQNLSKKGYNVLLIGMRSRETFKIQDDLSNRSYGFQQLVTVPMRYFPVVSQIMYTIVLSFFLPVYISLFNPDFVIMQPDISVLSSIHSIIVSKFRKTKFILDIRSAPVDACGFHGVLKKFWFNSSVVLAKRLFSGLTTITPMMKEEICSEFSIKPSRVGTWASGVSPTIFDPNEWRARGNELRAKLGLSGKFVVFYHGSLSDNRGISETIEATKIILKNHSGIALFLLGSGPFASELKFIIKKENLQHNVFIHNAVKYEQVPAFISMCDVGIIPLPNYSIWRPQSPLKLLEYLAMKKVVIATDLPAHRNVLDNQKCGIYLSSVNPQIIARGIEYALINKDKLGNWGDSGRKIILSNYTWEKVAGDLEHFLLGLRQNALYKS